MQPILNIRDRFGPSSNRSNSVHTGAAMRRLIPDATSRNHFNTIRIVLAMAVVWSHCFALYYGSEANEPISLLLGSAFNAGNIAVRMFFIISGFLIVMSYERSSSVRSYLRKRVARIYPGFIAAVLVCAFLVIPLFSTHVDFSGKALVRLFANLAILHPYLPASDVFSANPSQAVNGALWSIQMEFWCYLGVLALAWMGMLRKPVLVLAAALTFTAARALCDLKGVKPGFAATDFITGWPYLWTSIAPCFLAGALCWTWRRRLPRSKLILIGCLAAILISAHINQLLFEALFPYLTAYATMYFAFAATRIPDAAKWGDFSYGTYLYGFPTQQMVRTIAMPFALYVPLSLCCALICGIASWFLIERHFVKRRRFGVGVAVKDGQPGR